MRRAKVGVPDGWLRDQARACARADPCGVRGRHSARHRADGRRLRRRDAAAHRDHRPGPALHRGSAAAHDGLAARTGAAAAEGLVRAGPAGQRTRRDGEHQPFQVKALARGLPEAAWKTITWREGSTAWLTSRYARLRVRAAHRDDGLKEPRAEEWLLIEWPAEEAEPTKYWLATLPEDSPFAELVGLAKLRWRIERDDQELKQELGLGHYEGRGWRGFHHHATLCIAAYGFLIAERQTISPSGPRASPKFKKPAVPNGYRPRGAADPTRAAHPELCRNDAPTPHCRPRPATRAMSVLQRPAKADESHPAFLTQ